MRIGLLLIAAALTAGGCGKQTFDERVQQEVDDFNQKQSGRRTDPVTIMDSMHYDADGRILSYCYTVDGKADDPAVITDDVRELQHQQLLDQVKGSINLKPYKEEGITFRYVYYSATTGDVLMECVFSSADYR